MESPETFILVLNYSTGFKKVKGQDGKLKSDKNWYITKDANFSQQKVKKDQLYKFQTSHSYIDFQRRYSLRIIEH